MPHRREGFVSSCVHGAAANAPRRKTNTKEIIGTAGVQKILATIAEAGYSTPTVCIGGINESNIQRILFQSGAARKQLDGAAVVSAIMAAPNPERAARTLLDLVHSKPAAQHRVSETSDAETALRLVPDIIKQVHDTTPLSHNMTNLVCTPNPCDCSPHELLTSSQVVQNFAANVALSIGASPIMANYGEEAPDLCKLGGALVINMGTVTPDGLANYVKALKAYNQAQRPVVFDPVGYVSRY